MSPHVEFFRTKGETRQVEQVRKNVKYKQHFAVNSQTHLKASESVFVPSAF